MKLTGTLWRVRLGAPAMWGNITDRPAPYVGVINNEVNTMGCIRPGDTVLVVSERVKYSDTYPYLDSVQVATPVPGWCNASYFTSESIWLERVA